MTQAATPVISQLCWWELVALCYTEVAQRSCSRGRLYSSAALTAGGPAVGRGGGVCLM